MPKEFIVTNPQELQQVFQEILPVVKKTGLIKILASSIKSKSHQQLKFYWGVILPCLQKFLEDCGDKFSKYDINEAMNYKFFYKEVMINSEVVKIKRSKSTATMEEMRKFIDDVVMYCNDIGCFLPLPYDVEDMYK